MRKPVIKQIVSLLRQYGVRHLVCSPGSRNAALLQEVDAADDLKKLVVIDERSAAFIALGMSQVSQAPVALICTSGSALLNYSPAVSEAFYQGLPLIVISADRPEVWIDQDDSQTIRQVGALSNFVKATFDIDADNSSADNLWFVNRQINQGLNIALSRKCGPVHFNVRLDGKVPDHDNKPYDAKKIDVVTPASILDNKVIGEYAKRASGRKIMLVAGFMPPDHKLQKAVASFAHLPNVAVFAETVSNLHLPKECYMVDTVLFPMTKEKQKEMAPDILISLGGAVISRRLKEFIRQNPPEQHWSFSFAENLIDCFKALSVKLECSPAPFLKSLAKRIGREKTEEDEYSYADKWKESRLNSLKSLKHIAWSDLKALSVVFHSLPKEVNLFLSNGTSVRYGQIIPYSPTHATYANRGVSGIEGCTSTAIGASLLYDKFTCLVTGDMSFLYDLGGLAAQIAPATMRIIVLDNGGGDIFRFIPATCGLSIREDYLCADRKTPVALLADAFGWDYLLADSERSLKMALYEFFSPSLMPVILHIETRGQDNARILTDFLS